MACGGRSQSKMSEEGFDFICTTCDNNFNKVVEAVRYCIECSGYCCQSCTDTHALFPILKNHSLLDVSQGGKQQSSSPEFSTERCSLHKGKVLDMYCQEHDDVACCTCIATSHKFCAEENIYSIPDMIDTLFNADNSKQVKRLVENMMVSMSTISTSVEGKLEVLKEAKHEATNKVDTFEKALKCIISKAAEDTKSEIDAAYHELENEILQDKQNVDAVNDELQLSEGKLNKAEGNRAQNFVCTKQAGKIVKEANRLKGPKIRINQDVSLSFTPNQSLMNYLEGLHGIGKVNGQRKKVDLYKIKGSRDFNIRLSDDSVNCQSFGCCLTQDNKLLVTDYNNKKLKRIDLDTMTVVDSCKLDVNPTGVCCVSDKEAVVAYFNPGVVQFVSIQYKMSPTRQIKLPHKCYSITTKDDKLYVTDYDSSLYIYNMDGTLLKTITSDNTGSSLFSNSRHVTFNESGEKIFVGGGTKGLVCIGGSCEYLSTSTDSDLKKADGVCVDACGNVFVVGHNSNNVVQFNEEGKQIGVVVQQEDGLYNPQSVCFHQGAKKLFVTMNGRNVVKMYELE